MRPRLAAIVVALLTVLFVSACASGGAGAGSGTGTGGGTGGGNGGGNGSRSAAGATTTAAGGYAVTVHAGSRTERLDTARLDALPAVTVDTPDSTGDTRQSGPTLTSVLGAAGVTTFARLRVVGPSESLDLTPAEVTPQLVLAHTKRGTLKLAGPAVPPSTGVRDVTDIEVTG